MDPTVSVLDQLTVEGMAAYRRQCASEGVDPDIELATVRLCTGEHPAAWAALRIVRAAVGRRLDPTARAHAHKRLIGPSAHAGGLLDRTCPGYVYALAITSAPTNQGFVNAVLRRPGCPPELLTELAAVPAFQTGAAGNPCTPPEILRRLADDTTDAVAFVIAGNPGTPLDIVLAFVDDMRPTVRAAAIANACARPDTPDEIGQPLLAAAAASPHTEDRKGAATSPRLPIELADMLAADRYSTVRSRLARSSPHETILRGLARDRQGSVRIRVAKNPSTPADVLDLLADDRSGFVRTEVALNPAAPDRALRRLVDDPDAGFAARRELRRREQEASET